MLQTIKAAAVTIKTAQINIAAITVSVIALCFLPSVTGGSLSYPFAFTAGQVGFDTLAAAPIEFLDFVPDLDLSTERSPFDKSALASIGVVAHARVQDSDKGRPGLDVSPAALVTGSANPVLHQTRFELNVERVSFDTPTLAPMAFMRFCARYPRDCKASRIMFRPTPVALTKARKAELEKVNRGVNRAIKPQENTDGVMAEEWLVSPREGDCNDYAVTKRHELLARGWPSRSLLLAEVVIASGEHHLILVVRTRENDFVLDNLNWNVRPVSEIGYQWVRAQQTKNPRYWSTISVTNASRVALNSK